MKKILVIAFLMFGFVSVSFAQGGPLTAEQRAQNLSDQMIRELRLNNYQAREVREINLAIADKMLDIESQYAGNQSKIDQLCKGVCDNRDLALENVLSTVQYNKYYGNRKNLNRMDREFVAKANGINTNSGAVANASSSAPGTASVR